jgi:hypothetical protein
VDFSTLFQALATNPFPALLTLAVLAIGWLIRDGRRRDEEHEKKLEAANAAHLQTALQVAPLASKLVDCVEAAERLADRVDRALNREA